MENLALGGLATLFFVVIYTLSENWRRERRLRKQNELLNKESFKENGRPEEREVMKIVRSKNR